MITALLAPSENHLKPLLGNNAIVSPIPEEYGVDILFFAHDATFGFQRKEFPHDFVLSVYDGRLARATSLMRDKCDYATILLEGQERYGNKGYLITNKKMPYHMKYSQVHGVLWTAWATKGVSHEWTNDIYQTAEYIRLFAKYLGEEFHTSLITRPKVKGAWITPSIEEQRLWVLQSFAGIGPANAAKILKHFGGRMPIRWSCDLDDLEKVSGISSGRCREMYEVLNGPAAKPPEPLEKQVPTKAGNNQDRISELIRRMKGQQ